MSFLKRCIPILVCFYILSGAGCADEHRTITDMLGRTIEVPTNIERVIAIDDGFVEGIVYRFGMQDKIIALGSASCKDVFNYNFTTFEETVVVGDTYEYPAGMNTVRYLIPRFSDLPVLFKYGAPAVNYEMLSSLEPDVVFIRAGTWAFPAGSDEKLEKTIATIESLEIPLIILLGPPYQERPNVDNIGEEIRLVGEVLSHQDDADLLASYLELQIAEIQNRTDHVTESEKPHVMQLGLSSRAREAGGAAMGWGLDTIESYFIEDIANAKNAYSGTGAFVVLSAEQILALDPDVIVLPTAQGYHPASELYTAPYYQNLQGLSAVKKKRVYALPYTPSNWAKRLEYPIETMIIAKAAYPDRFADIKVHEWVLDFYKNVYGVDDETARGLRSAQRLDWTVEEDF